jgi:hypothetical protein
MRALSRSSRTCLVDAACGRERCSRASLRSSSAKRLRASSISSSAVRMGIGGFKPFLRAPGPNPADTGKELGARPVIIHRGNTGEAGYLSTDPVKFTALGICSTSCSRFSIRSSRAAMRPTSARRPSTFASMARR